MRALSKPQILALAFGALTLAGVGSVVPATAAETPFIVNYSQPPPSLDPTVVCDIGDGGFISPLYTTLLQNSYKPVPNAAAGVTVLREDETAVKGYLAESYSVSEDGKTITLKLRDGVKFSTGRPVDAKAVVASLTRALKSGKCGTYFAEAAQFGNTEAIEAPDDKTVVIKLKRAEPLVINALTQPQLGIVDVEEIKAKGEDWIATHVAGSGPYLLAEYQPGVRAVFKANPDFFGPKPLEPEVIVNFITDNSTLLLQARNGKADVTLGLTKASIASLEGAKGLKIIKLPVSRWELLGFPTLTPPFDNAKFREGLTYGVPYAAILKNVAHGYGESYYGPFPPSFPAFNPKSGAPRAYDVAKAKALIAESGVKTPVPLDIVIREGWNDQEQIATILQGAWKPLGVDVTIKKLPASAYQEAVMGEKKPSSIIRIDGPSVGDPAWLLDYDMRCKSIFNISNYCNPKAEALLDEAHPIADPAKRQAYWDQIAELWIADSPRVPLFADVYTAVVSDKVKNWTFAQDGPFDLNLWSR